MSRNSLLNAPMGFALLFFCGASQHVIHADDSEYMSRPLAVVASAGLERFEEDVVRLATVSEHEDLLNIYQKLKNNINKLPGVDKTRPFGAAIVLRRDILDSPAGIAFLPVTDGTSLVKSLQQKLPVITDVSDGRWKVKLPKLQLHIHLQDDYLLISQNEELLSLVTEDFLAEIQVQTKLNDLYARVDFLGLSEPVRSSFVRKINNDMKKEEIRKPEESDDEFRLRSQLIELIKATFLHVVSDSQSLTAGIQIESEVAVNLHWKAKTDSVLATQLNHLELDPSKVSLQTNGDAPFQAQLGVKIPQELQAFLLEAFHLARKQIKDEIGPQLAEMDRGPLKGAFDALEKTVQRGDLIATIAFNESNQNNMILLAGLNIMESDLVKNFLETILPYVRDSEDIQEVELNFHQSKGLSLHRLQGRNQREEDRRLYGDSASLFVGVSSDRFWIALGDKQTPDLLEERVQRKGSPNAGQILAIEFSLDPWLVLAEKHQHDLKKIKMVRQAIPNAEDDRITFELKAVPDGLSASLNAQAGYFKLFGIALKEDQKKNKQRSKSE
ncbi:hypothetical protein OAF42_02985 [Planctomicrobium sp.]|jgi:hypothetical protein|nr:hypothetical protein [Planctomicrobium sp.]MBT5021016.1 hypothetical protein [Planctomicrobium sp.]MDB4733389.1 hypothetical protein [Planctomicrobium sp.]